MKTFLPVFLFLISFLTSFSQIKLDSGLVAYYPFSGNANDASSNGNNAIFNNAALANDRFGNPNCAYSFNGIDNYIRVSNSLSLNTGSQISLCVYVRVNGFYNGPCHGNDIINKGQYQSNPNFYFIRFDDYAFTNGANCSNAVVDTLHQNFYSSDATVASPGYSPYIAKNQWYCLVYTYDGFTASFFIDNNLISRKSAPGLSFGNSDDLYLGRLFLPSNPASFPYWFNGVMDEVRIYNRAISEQEIFALCPAGALPLTLTNFETHVTDKQIKLNWRVENEDGIRNFTVERSLTGHSDFVSLETIAARNIHSYSFADNTADLNQTYYYRLAILENDGILNYSEIKTAKIIAKNKLIVVYPNPSNGIITIRLNGYTGNAKFTIINSVGQVVMEKSEIIIDNSQLLKLTIQPKGLYWLKVEANNEESVQRIIVF